MSVDKQKTILLVEDEALIAMAETNTLEKHGFKVITVNAGEKAIETVGTIPGIDLVLMDIDLGPGIEGTEAAVAILEKHDLPLIFLSSHTEREVVDKTEGITSYGYIVKNSGETVLITSIKMAFRLYDSHQESKRQKEKLRAALTQQEQVEKELIEKNEELDRYFTSSLDMLCLADVNGRFLRLNPEWENVLGYPVSELEGRTFMDFVHEDDKEVTLATIAQLKNQNEVFSFENRYRRADGTYRWIEWRSKPIGSTIYAAARDVTDRKRTEQALATEKERLAVTLKSIGDGVIATDLNGNVERINEVAEVLTGWTHDNAWGRPLSEVFTIVNALTRQRCENPVEKALKDGKVVGLANHTILISADGTEYQIADSAAPIRDSNDRVIGVVLVFRDVTKEYAAEEALRERERDLKRAQALAKLGFWRLDFNSGLVIASDEAAAIYGLTQSEWTIEQVRNISLLRYRNALEFELKNLVEKGVPYDIEFEIKRPVDGAIRHIHSVAEYDAEKNSVLGTIQDITDLKKAEQTLRGSIDHSSAVMNGIDAIVFLADPQTHELLFVNKRGLDVWGKDIVGQSCWKALQALDEPCPFCTNSKLVEADGRPGGVVHWEHRNRKDGRWYEMRDCVIEWTDGRLVKMGIATDITSRRQAENEMALSQTRLKKIMDAGNIAWWEMDLPSGAVRFDEKKARMIGYEPERFSHYEDFTRLLHPEDYDQAMQVMMDHLAGKADRYDVEYRIKAAAGDYHWFRDIGQISEHDETQNTQKITGIVIDISDHKAMEEALKESERKFRLLFENHAVVQLVIDPDTGNFVDANNAAAEFYGWSRAELKQMSIHHVSTLSADDLAKRMQLAKRSNSYCNELKHRKADGTLIDVEIRANGIEINGSMLLYAIINDISARKQAEEKINALFQEKELLLRETHHRVKNNMNTIYSLLTIQSDLEENSAASRILKDASGRIRSMMMLYDKLYRSENVNELNINGFLPPLIDEIVCVFNSQPPVRTEIQIADIILSANTLSPLGIILNELITNSMKYAFQGIENRQINVSVSKTDSNVRFEYADNGVGLPASVDLENSTGFGMRLVNMLVRQIDGSARIERNAGTRYIIEFPVS